MPELDYAVVNQYWSGAEPSSLAPYMMDGFGFPPEAGRFRFRAESQIVRRLISDLSVRGTVLDLGSGMGHWAEFFARDFSKVVAVEASTPLFQALKERCRSYPHIRPVHGSVMSFEPEGRYSLIFFGGLLMYLNTKEVTLLLRRLVPFLEEGGMILCRETTVRAGTVTREGEYQAAYRSVATYSRMFQQCGLLTSHIELNVPYVLLQMGCEFVRKWKALVPSPLRMTPAVGRLAYWGLRCTNPWAVRVPQALGLPFPELRNHFFVLRASD